MRRVVELKNGVYESEQTLGMSPGNKAKHDAVASAIPLTVVEDRR